LARDHDDEARGRHTRQEWTVRDEDCAIQQSLLSLDGCPPYDRRKNLPIPHRKKIVIMMIAMSLWLCTSPAFAQHTLRNLTGIVTDPHHEPLKGAVVEVHNDDNDSVVSYITGRSGRYSFKRLDGETDYRVWATRNGQQSRTKKLSQFDANSAKTINLIIRIY
jgi:hypothetical protein